jgi:hypothetical protein
MYRHVGEYFNSPLPPQKRRVLVSYLKMLITNEPWLFFVSLTDCSKILFTHPLRNNPVILCYAFSPFT